MQIGDKLRKGLRLLGSMLIGERLASEEQVRAALEEQERRKRRGSPHKRLGELLVEMSVVADSDVDRMIAEQERARRSFSEDIDRVLADRMRAKQREAMASPFVSSSHGKVFHARDCKAVERINPANLQGFSSREEAESAGKRACSKCC